MSAPHFDLSLIICSIDPDNALRTCENVKATSGLNVECVVVDNRERHWPIAKAYNYGAGQASAPYLMFLHEDVLFQTNGWGKPLIDQLAIPTTGVIGFIGSQVRTHAYSPWSQKASLAVGSVWINLDGQRQILNYHHPIDTLFREVVVVDGLGFSCRKDVWAEYPFDEEMLTGFHCYDIDFSFVIAHHYTNYVYFGGMPLHLSNGNYSADWAETTVRLTDRKWSKLPPVAVDMAQGQSIEKITALADYSFLRTLIRKVDRFPKSLVKPVLRRYHRRCLKSKYYLLRLPLIYWIYFFKRVIKKQPQTLAVSK